MEKINILLVDDHTIVRDGIKATLKDQSNFIIMQLNLLNCYIQMWLLWI
jgi:DNA-binding NarL/FixJ family response regulator